MKAKRDTTLENFDQCSRATGTFERVEVSQLESTCGRPSCLLFVGARAFVSLDSFLDRKTRVDTLTALRIG